MKIKNKWIVLLGAVLAQLTIGSIYSWSLFNAPIAEAYNLNIDQVLTTYQIAIFFFAAATLISGPMNIKYGPRLTALAGAVLYAGGVIMTAFSTTPIMLYISYGMIAGLGVGFVYVVPLATLVKWFPKYKGTFTGVSVGTFAAGSIIFKQVIGGILGNGPFTPDVITSTFLKLGLIYFVVAGIGALMLDTPEQTASTKAEDEGSIAPRQVIKSRNFVLLFIAFLATTMPGILVMGAAADIGMDLAGMTYEAAGYLVTVAAITNASARLLSGMISDKVGPMNVMKIMAVVTTISLAMLALLDLNSVTFTVAMLGIVAGYGSFLAMFPSVVAKLWGSKYYAANYGIVYQGYGLAALVGPVIKSSTTGFAQTFLISIVIAIIGLVLVILVNPKHEKKVSLKTELAYSSK